MPNLFRKVYGWPIVLGLLSLVGLLCALLGDGAWDAASWVALAIPLAAILLFQLRARKRKP